MSDDIVTRLRNECQCSDNCRAVGDPCIAMTAADEIERLRADANTLLATKVVLLCPDCHGSGEIGDIPELRIPSISCDHQNAPTISDLSELLEARRD